MFFPTPIVDKISSNQPLEISSISTQDFYNILITQIRNQNPLDPLKSEKVVSEVLQFSNTEKLDQIGGELQSILSGSKELNPYQLLGKQVTFEDDQIQVPPSGNVQIGYGLTSDASKGNLEIFDQNGNLIRKIQLSEDQLNKTDYQTLPWNCEDYDGNRVPSGNYTFRLNAWDSDGEPIISLSEKQGIVGSIRFDKNAPKMVIDGHLYELSKILEVS